MDALLRYAPQSLELVVETDGTPSDITQDDTLTNLLNDRLRCLVDILRSIDVDANARRHLSKNVRDDIQRHYCYLKTKLFEVYSWALGSSRSIEGRRSRLEIQLDKLNEESRREQVQMWQDIEQLRREWRGWFKQYCDLVQRLRLVGVGVTSPPVLLSSATASMTLGGGQD